MSIFDTSPFRPNRAGEETGEFADFPRSRTPEAQSLLDRMDELLDVCDVALAGCVEYPGAPVQNGRFFSSELVMRRIDRALDAYEITDPAAFMEASTRVTRSAGHMAGQLVTITPIQ